MVCTRSLWNTTLRVRSCILQHVCIMYARLSVCTYFVYICMHMRVHAVQEFKQVCHKNAYGTCRACSFLRMCMCACARVCMYACTPTTQRNVTLHHVMQCNVMIFNSMSKSRLGQRKHEKMFLLPKKQKNNKQQRPESRLKT